MSADSVARRVIARLDIKGPNLVKGIQLEGLRVIGDPSAHALRYYEQGVDELLYIDIVASLYGRNNLVDVVRKTAAEIFVPLTVGGGVRSIDDIRTLLRAGADKVAINTAAVGRPELISEAARVFGSQCIVGSIEAKRRVQGGWEAYTDNGRERTGRDVVEWTRRLVELGVGEVLLTSVDNEGMQRGLDLELIRAVGRDLPVPLIACGGTSSPANMAEGYAAGADAIAVAALLHYKKETVGTLKSGLRERGIEVRP
jgi:cyclase